MAEAVDHDPVVAGQQTDLLGHALVEIGDVGAVGDTRDHRLGDHGRRTLARAARLRLDLDVHEAVGGVHADVAQMRHRPDVGDGGALRRRARLAEPDGLGDGLDQIVGEEFAQRASAASRPPVRRSALRRWPTRGGWSSRAAGR